jgi:chromosome segregation protein
MRLKTLEINGFKSFAHKTILSFDTPVVSVVGPNGSGKSNVVEAVRFVLGEQSMKSMRGKAGTDLIFKGSKNLPKGSRASVVIHLGNQDKVFKLTNDSGEEVNLNFETISIGREVYPDGLNKYILNGEEVRLKDIHNLLASVNIGSSGHHIISQGEADRILNASARDRREMVEDALGLKVYQYKIKDSERKLEKTNANMKEVALLRRENAPHLNFLKKQVEKVEKAKEMQAELLQLYREYLKKESVYLNNEGDKLRAERNTIKKELDEVDSKLKEVEGDVSEKNNEKIEELKKVENKLNEIRAQKGELERKLGRIEGMIEAKENRVQTSGRCPTCGKELSEVTEGQTEARQHYERELAELKNSQIKTAAEIKVSEAEEANQKALVEALKQEINAQMESLRDKEREKFSWKVRHQELTSSLNIILVKEENLNREKQSFENELREGAVLVGREINSYTDFAFEGQVDRAAQDEQHKKIERIKIKLEDAGTAGGAEIMKEFQEVTERDQFLGRELEDLAKSIDSLNRLIADLKEKIDIEFKNGVKKINTEFQQFFALMFGGGNASLSMVLESKKRRRGEDEEESDEEELIFEQGIEINVALPHKKVRELHAFSGGERSLTSIALLFAMSQVNPPPFLILDETDAALDEANSRKYGDMLEKLSKHSQLVVVTHNRETMSRAGALYGVTIGSDGASKLLSVKFDEAAAIAK